MLTCIVSYDIDFLQQCYDNFDSDMKCLAPRLNNKNGTSKVVIGLQMDNVRNLLILEDVNITVFTDPIFNTGLNFEIQPGQSQNLTLTVSVVIFGPCLMLPGYILFCFRVKVSIFHLPRLR